MRRWRARAKRVSETDTVDENGTIAQSAALSRKSITHRTLHRRGMALVVIEHHLQALKALVPRLVVMDQGHIIADGPPDQVLEDPRVQSAYMGGVV